jgi:hypothetical protein
MVPRLDLWIQPSAYPESFIEISDAPGSSSQLSPGEELQEIESEIEWLKLVKKTLKDLGEGMTPPNQAEKAAGKKAKGLSFLLDKVSEMMGHLQVLPPSVQKALGGAGKVQDLATITKGVIDLVEDVKEGGSDDITGEEMSDLAEKLGQVSAIFSFVGLKGGPVTMGPFLTLYQTALGTVSRYLIRDLIPHVERTRVALGVLDEMMPAVPPGTFDPVREAEEAADEALREKERRATDLRNEIGIARSDELEEAKKKAFENLTTQGRTFKELKDNLDKAYRSLQEAGVELWELYGLTGNTYGLETDEQTKQRIEELKAKAPDLFKTLKSREEAYRRARDEYLEATREIRRVFLDSAEPEERRTLWDWLNDYHGELFPGYHDERIYRWYRRLERAFEGQIGYDPGTEPISERPPDELGVIDLALNPHLLSTNWADFSTISPHPGGQPPILFGTIESTGNPTGPGAFKVNIVNHGEHPVRLIGEGLVLQPIAGTQDDGLRDWLNPARNGVRTEFLDGYCLRKDLLPPFEGQLFTPAGATIQEQFEPQRQILASSQELWESGLLHPQGDPDEYYHSVTQWAIYSYENGYNEDSFGDAFVQHTRENFEAAGEVWSTEAEAQAYTLVAGRWDDIDTILGADEGVTEPWEDPTAEVDPGSSYVLDLTGDDTWREVTPTTVASALRDLTTQLGFGTYSSASSIDEAFFPVPFIEQPLGGPSVFSLSHLYSFGTINGPQEGPGQLIHLTSRGTLGGSAMDLQVYSPEGQPAQLQGGAVVLEPVMLSESNLQDVERELEDVGGETPAIDIPIDVYCLEFLRQPPSPETVFRIAGPELQKRFESLAKVVDAGRKLNELGLLNPDSDPSQYFHSTMQWALWSQLEGLDLGSFGEAFLEETKKNFATAGQDWTGRIEEAVRQLIPNRWSDIERILAEVNRQ